MPERWTISSSIHCLTDSVSHHRQIPSLKHDAQISKAPVLLVTSKVRYIQVLLTTGTALLIVISLLEPNNQCFSSSMPHRYNDNSLLGFNRSFVVQSLRKDLDCHLKTSKGRWYNIVSECRHSKYASVLNPIGIQLRVQQRY